MCAAFALRRGLGLGPQIKSGAGSRSSLGRRENAGMTGKGWWEGRIFGMGVGCCSRRDTPVRAGGRLRGKRGYDGVGVAGMTE